MPSIKGEVEIAVLLTPSFILQLDEGEEVKLF